MQPCITMTVTVQQTVYDDPQNFYRHISNQMEPRPHCGTCHSVQPVHHLVVLGATRPPAESCATTSGKPSHTHTRRLLTAALRDVANTVSAWVPAGFASTATQPRDHLLTLLRDAVAVDATLHQGQVDQINTDIVNLRAVTVSISAMGTDLVPASLHHFAHTVSLLDDDVLDASEAPSTVLFPATVLTRPSKLRPTALRERARLRDPQVIATDADVGESADLAAW